MVISDREQSSYEVRTYLINRTECFEGIGK